MITYLNNCKFQIQETKLSIQEMTELHERGYDRALFLFLHCLSKSTKLEPSILLEKYRREVFKEI
jgi:hypothetical protein